MSKDLEEIGALCKHRGRMIPGDTFVHYAVGGYGIDIEMTDDLS